MPKRREQIEFSLNGRSAFAEMGVSVAVAVLGNGVTAFRQSVTGEARGPVCGMGVCYECRLTINGATHQKSCQIVVTPGMAVQTDE